MVLFESFVCPYTNLFENVQDLMEQQEKQDKTVRKLKKQLKFYMKKVDDFEGNHDTDCTLHFVGDISTKSILSLLILCFCCV